MRRLALLLACLLASQSAGAESSIEAMTAFGLLGSWSNDCSKPLVCDQKVCGARGIFEVLPSGQPMSRTVTDRTVESEIESATRMGDDKIKLVSTLLQSTYSSGVTVAWSRQPGERWELLLLKSDSKYRLYSAKSEDGKKIGAEEGFVVRPPSGTNIDQLPASWVRTAQETPWINKCTSPAEDSIISGVFVKSPASGHAVTFPARPREEIINHPATKVVLNVLRDGNAMFSTAEGLTTLQDAAADLEPTITNFVSRFPSAAVSSTQNADVIAASGRKLPAKTFTFAGKDTIGAGNDAFGQGIVVASGRYVVTVVATDLKNAVNPTGKRLAMQKFVSSLKFEK